MATTLEALPPACELVYVTEWGADLTIGYRYRGNLYEITVPREEALDA